MQEVEPRPRIITKIEKYCLKPKKCQLWYAKTHITHCD